MNNNDALQIMRALADGISPDSGEPLSNDSIFQSTKITRALFASISALEHKIRTDTRRQNLPSNAGNPWKENEEKLMVEEFDKGESVTEIAKRHGRTRGAIQSRLLKLGKLEIIPDIESKSDLSEEEVNQDTNIAHIDIIDDIVECIDCGEEISKARIRANPNANRCVHCQGLIEKINPSSIKRMVDDGLAGSREDHKKLRANLYSDMRNREL
jgi:RNA polymerase-binding transcription factor DksA